MRTRDVKDGEWVRPVMTGYHMECCNCGVVHVMDFRVTKERGFEMRGTRLPQDQKGERQWHETKSE
jgi:hypothetical protein